MTTTPNTTSADIAEAICQAVAELDDRGSPADWPEAMLVTSDELHQIVTGALAASAPPMAEPSLGWHAFPRHLQHPDGRLLRTASDLLDRHGYSGCAGPIRNMADALLAFPPAPANEAAPVAPAPEPAAPQGDVAAWLVLADGEPHHVTPGKSDEAARLWAEEQTKCGAPYSFTFLPLSPPATQPQQAAQPEGGAKP